TAHVGGDVEAERLQPRRHLRGGLRLLERQLRVLVQVAVQRLELRVERVRGGLQRVRCGGRGEGQGGEGMEEHGPATYSDSSSCGMTFAARFSRPSKPWTPSRAWRGAAARVGPRRPGGSRPAPRPERGRYQPGASR